MEYHHLLFQSSLRKGTKLFPYNRLQQRLRQETGIPDSLEEHRESGVEVEESPILDSRDEENESQGAVVGHVVAYSRPLADVLVRLASTLLCKHGEVPDVPWLKQSGTLHFSLGADEFPVNRE